MSSIFSIKKGAGNPVILIHGFCETHEIWNDLSDSIASKFQVFTPDLPGFGGSSRPNNSFSISELAQLVLDWVEDLEIKNPVIIGHSLGGYVALAMAAKRPNFFRGLALFHSTAQADTQEKKENRNKVIDFVTKNGAEPFIDSFVPALFFLKKTEWIERVRKIALTSPKDSIVEYSKAMRDRPDCLNFLKTLKMPVLFISGDQDTLIPPQKTQLEAEICENSQFCLLSDTGHMGMIESLKESIFIVNNFLENSFCKNP